MRLSDHYDVLVAKLYEPRNAASLGIVRFLFGLLMLLDLSEERGGGEIDIRWGDPRDCHFPLIHLMEPLTYPYMSLLYGAMMTGAVFIMLGYKFRLGTFMFGVPYWYIFLLDKSFWNNHSYLFGIVTLLLMGSSANHYFSIDSLLDPTIRDRPVPYWNYFILKFQFFLLYFLAGLKKTDAEWLEGYSMSNLGTHWVFAIFRLVLSAEQVDYLIVHWFGFLLDLTIGFWLLIEVTRPVAMVFCAFFHLMNSRLFSIGMFPYVCLATMPLFCKETWPVDLFRRKPTKLHDRGSDKITWRKRIVTGLLIGHSLLQVFLPYSHFITKGYNNWTNGLYGYSWDMMVHSWDTTLVVVKIVDNESGLEHFLDSEAWTHNDRWTKHADMCVQYAQCLNRNILLDKASSHKMSNVSIYIDVWCSLNGRFQQRMYDPHYDLLRADWSPFRRVNWLMPLLNEYKVLRTQINELSRWVYSWSNYTDLLFIADFPGLYLENYISEDLDNVTLSVIEGEVMFNDPLDDNVTLGKGQSHAVTAGRFHRVYTVSEAPSCYMYVYVNKTKQASGEDTVEKVQQSGGYSPFPLVEDLEHRLDNFLRMIGHISSSFLHVLYDQPLVRRTRLRGVA